MRNSSRSWGGTFDIPAKRETLSRLENQMADAGFWSNQEQAQSVVQQVKTLKGWVESFTKLDQSIRSAIELTDMLDAEPDDGMIAELDAEVTAIGNDLESFRLKSLLSGPDDARDVQLEIAAGAGG